MKKILILFLFAGLAFSTTSCKKKQKCPEPEVWAVGTWQATKVVDNGTEQDPSDPTTACWLTDEMVLDEDGGGTLSIHDYDSGTCQDLGWTLKAWAENLDKKVLNIVVTTGYGTESIKFNYVDDTHIRWMFDANSYEELTKQ